MIWQTDMRSRLKIAPELSARLWRRFGAKGSWPSKDADSGRRPELTLACDLERELSGSDGECTDINGIRLRPAIPKITNASDGPASGTVMFGGYRLLRLVGEGGMGAVYEAEQISTRRIVALKFVKSGFASPGLLKRFDLEAQALGRLRHPCIAQIYEAGTVDAGFGPQPYFAMEFIRGRTLAEYAEVNKLTTRKRLEIIAKVCGAVHHAHKNGLIHRDLKPANILVDETGEPKVVDFGVARVAGEEQASVQTAPGQLVGTLAYMSPEQTVGNPTEVDQRSDVYALGVILYELLSGNLPYPLGNNLAEAISSIRHVHPLPLAAYDRRYRGELTIIADKALAKNKAQRYNSAEVLAADIECHLTNRPISARAPTVPYRLRKLLQRRGLLFACFVGVLLVFVVCLYFLSIEEQRERTEMLRQKDFEVLELRMAFRERTSDLLEHAGRLGLPLDFGLMEHVRASMLATLGVDAFPKAWFAGTSYPSIWPVAGRVARTFGRNSNPFSGIGEFHKGVDIALPDDLSVVATANGVVMGALFSEDLALIAIDHGGGMQTYYAYLSKISVRKGDRVLRGQQIGQVMRPHLHYEIHVAGSPVDPYRFLVEPRAPNQADRLRPR